MQKLPAPRSGPIRVRVATMADLPFLDGLQKLHHKQLGYFPTQQFQGYIEMGAVLIADCRLPIADLNSIGNPVGYIISRDRYLKRDELGVIFQLCVAPDARRGLIGATLVREVFERSAYGCRLFCCWCAQDLPANHFWESLGFVPLAFRGGSGKKKRVHIFWQKRIRAGDETTPWWFPNKTAQGALRADRLVLPIPPGVRWWDAMPVLAGEEVTDQNSEVRSTKNRARDFTGGPLPPTRRRRAGVQFGPPSAKPAVAHAPEPAKPVRTKPPKQQPKCDPKLVAAARELRDRYLEEINAGRLLPGTDAKYDVSRALEAPQEAQALKALPSAA